MAARQSGEGSESETEESTPAFGGEDPSDAAHARKQGEEVGSVAFGFVTNFSPNLKTTEIHLTMICSSPFSILSEKQTL